LGVILTIKTNTIFTLKIDIHSQKDSHLKKNRKKLYRTIFKKGWANFYFFFIFKKETVASTDSFSLFVQKQNK